MPSLHVGSSRITEFFGLVYLSNNLAPVVTNDIRTAGYHLDNGDGLPGVCIAAHFGTDGYDVSRVNQDAPWLLITVAAKQREGEHHLHLQGFGLPHLRHLPLPLPLAIALFSFQE